MDGAEAPHFLELRDVSVIWGAQTLLRAISLQVPAQTVLGIIGPNGAGKTTLMNVIVGQITPTQGRVIYRGQDITAWPPPSPLPCWHCPDLSDSPPLRGDDGLGKRRCGHAFRASQPL